MEKKGLRKKDILRMDGLLPPTRRLPVCDAVSSSSNKKKEKKWSIGGILRRISSMRDYDGSSNDEEIVYCDRAPRKPAKLGRRSEDVVLHSVDDNLKRRMTVESHSTDSHRDSLHSRSSDGSLDGLGKKIQKNKLKARAEAKRDYLCVESSSDDDRRRSDNSLNRIHDADGAKNGQKNNMCNRRTRAARTERYIKRLSRDEGNGTCDSLYVLCNKRRSVEYIGDKRRAVYADANASYRPPVHPRRFDAYPNSNRAFPVRRSSAESPRDAHRASLPSPNQVFSDYGKYFAGQYDVADSNRNDTRGKIFWRGRASEDANDRRAGNFFTYPAKNAGHYSESFDYVIDHRSVNSESQPPVPPPRDPRYRVLDRGYSSYSTNGRRSVPNSFEQRDNETDVAREIYFGSYGSSNEIARRDRAERDVENSPNSKTALRDSLDCTNNEYNRDSHRANESTYEESEATRCRRRNDRNDRLSYNDAWEAYDKSANKRETILSRASVASSDRSSGRSSRSIAPRNVNDDQGRNDRGTYPTEEDSENGRTSSKNLEEALSELEAIYNSLRLGDEDLLDRAERRSMEEFSLRQAKSELDAAIAITPDSPDRTKDDMAYRRMRPKERPASLSDIAGRSTPFNISYLIASPVLSRRDSANDPARLPSTYPSRRNEPDAKRDDVVFRSINHANNTLRVIDPQPPFGIPLGPVATATESDYLHTTPTKLEQPRSPYIPQREPDVVTDDLAYRTLRKDAGAARNVVTTENRVDVSNERPRVGVKKKRAIGSSSADLYGSINQDRIHSRREPNFNTTAMLERPEYLGRVASDGESAAITRVITDINGNRPTVNAYRKKLRVDVSPEAATEASPEKEKEPGIGAKLSDAALSSTTVSDDQFWHEYSGSDSNVPMTENGRGAETTETAETAFTAYSRLCQDLVNSIKNDGDAPLSSIESSNDPAVVPTAKFDFELEVDERPSTSVVPAGRSVSSDRYPERTARANDERNPTAFSITNSARSASETTPTASDLDFYLCEADENVEIIAAEAFGDSVDRLRDDSFASRSSEVENQSSGARASSTTRLSSRFDETTTTSDDSRFEGVSTVDEELSRAVRDLELAAASLYEHGREIEDLGKKTDVRRASTTDGDNPIGDRGPPKQERERDREETMRSDARDEGERRRVTSEDAWFVNVSRVTNIVTVTLTTYSMLLLACLLALLLAIVAASS